MVRSRETNFIWERTLKTKMARRISINILIPTTKQHTAKELTEERLTAILPHCCVWARGGRSGSAWASSSGRLRGLNQPPEPITHRGLRLTQVHLAWKGLSILQVYLSYTSWWSHPTDGAHPSGLEDADEEDPGLWQNLVCDPAR